MKKRDKLKTLFKKSPFGEKLENALQNKAEAKNSPLKIQFKPTSSPVAEIRPIENEKSSVGNKPEAFSVSIFKSETMESKTTAKSFLKAEEVNEFLRIMEDGFLKNISPQNAVRVNLGVDLGTSFSKVVWRLGENSYPLCFGQNSSKLDDYLMPSIVAFGKTELTCGAEISEEEEWFSLANFKMCLACESEKSGDCSIRKCLLTKWDLQGFSFDLNGDEAAFVNAFFLAKLLAEAKKSVVAELENKGFRQPFEVKWTANFSVPEKFIEQSPISAAFEKVFKTAWLMSEVFLEKPEINKRQVVFEIYLAAKDLAEELETREKPFDCFPYSEVVAEVAAVIRPRTSEEGLYAFVDIGAGTVDASVFRFNRSDGATECVSYAIDIFKKGATHIETRANKKLVKDSVEWLKDVKERYLELAETERGQLLTPVITFLEEASKEIKNETLESLIRVFSHAYHDKECDINKWQELKLVLGGGGSKLKTYQDAAKHAFTLNRETEYKKLPETVILPKPDDFQTALPKSEFHRFAVAYGLSHEIANLPEIIFAKDVAPLHQLTGQNRLDRDDDR